ARSGCLPSPRRALSQQGAGGVPERALVVIPTYNEAANLPSLAPQVLAQDARLELLVVDDNSPDGTGRLADELAARERRVHVLHRDGELHRRGALSRSRAQAACLSERSSSSRPTTRRRTSPASHRRCSRRTRASSSWSWTTTRRTARAASPTSWTPGSAGCTCCTETASSGSVRPTSRGFAGPWSGATITC